MEKIQNHSLWFTKCVLVNVRKLKLGCLNVFIPWNPSQIKWLETYLFESVRQFVYTSAHSHLACYFWSVQGTWFLGGIQILSSKLWNDISLDQFWCWPWPSNPRWPWQKLGVSHKNTSCSEMCNLEILSFIHTDICIWTLVVLTQSVLHVG